MSGPSEMATPSGASARAWDTLARAAAAAGQQADDSRMLTELLSFRLGADPYALPVERVREIVRIRPITEVPRVPQEVLGVISLRGEVVQVVDLRMRVGLEPTPPVRKTRIIVLHGDEGEVAGLLVDAVDEVLRVGDEDLRPASGESEFVSGLCVRGEDFVSVMNLERVLDLG